MIIYAPFRQVPFRQSKLTYLLQDALSGNSKTWMLANISPAQAETEETQSTLRFAQSVKKVKLTAFANQANEAETDLMLQTMMTEIDDLRSQLHSNHNPSSPKAGRLRRWGLSRGFVAVRGFVIGQAPYRMRIMLSFGRPYSP